MTYWVLLLQNVKDRVRMISDWPEWLMDRVFWYWLIAFVRFLKVVQNGANSIERMRETQEIWNVDSSPNPKLATAEDHTRHAFLWPHSSYYLLESKLPPVSLNISNKKKWSFSYSSVRTKKRQNEAQKNI